MPAPPTSVIRSPKPGDEATYRELRIQTILQCRIITLLSQLIGPIPPQLPQGSTAAWWPEDPSADVDLWRTDPTFL